jgi:type I restriction enzyme S subunit
MDEFELVTDTEEGLEQLKKLILNLAVRGKLTKQDSHDEPAEKLLRKVNTVKQRLYKTGKIRKPKKIEDTSSSEFPFEIPNNWVWTKLVRTCYFELGKTPRTKNSKYWDRDGIKWASISDLPERGFIKDTDRKVSKEAVRKVFKKEPVPEGTLLMSFKLSIGKVAITQVPLYHNEAIISFKILPKSLKAFYFWFLPLLSVQGKTKGAIKGNTLNSTTLRNLYIPLPPLEEQQRIVQKIESLFAQVHELEQKVRRDRTLEGHLQVAVLDDLQQAQTPEASKQSWQRITAHFKQNYRKPEHIDQLKQAILNEAVRGRLVLQNPNDEPAEHLLECIIEEKQRLYEKGEIRKPKELPEITEEEIPYKLPDGWCWCRIGSTCSISGGKRVPKGFSLQNKPTPYIYIRVTDMKDGTIIDNGLKYISEEVKSRIAKYTISKNDLYITIAGTIGDVGSVPEKFDEMNLTENAAKIKFYLLNKYYLKRALNSPVVQAQFLKKVNKMAQPKLALKRIRSTVFPLPPLQEQKRIIQKIDELFTWCDNLKTNLIHSQQTDRELLEAFVNEKPDDEEVTIAK